MKNFIKKKVVKGIFAFGILLALTGTMSVNVKASTPPFSAYVYGEVADDGVRLRKTPASGGTVLELMYRGETVWIDLSTSEVNGFKHVQRDKTGTVGYTSSNLIIIY